MADEDLDFMAEIIAEFLVESNELLEKLDTDLIALEKSPDDLDLINEIFRAAHTFKGTSGFLGFDKMMRLTHAAEDILNRMRKGNLSLTPEIMDAILETVDVLRTFLDNISETNKEGDVEVDPLIEVLNELNAQDSSETAATAEDEPVQEAEAISEEEVRNEEQIDVDAPTTDEDDEGDADDEFSDGSDHEEDIVVAEEEEEVVAIVEEKSRNSVPAKPQPAKSPVANKAPAKPDVQPERRTTAAPKASANENKDAKTTQSVRVPVSRLDHLMNLAGELVLGRNRLNQVNTFFEASMHSMQSSDSRSDEMSISAEKEMRRLWEHNVEMLSETNSALALITSELQMAIMQTRMMPVASLFKKVPRLIRTLSREMNKKVELVVEGEETELDKSVIEELGDPLTHLLRNSMDHGVEAPAKRNAAGKNPVGTIRLFAKQQGNHIIIGIEDDGAGIDAEHVKARAVERGILSESEAERMNEREAFNLIFQPGFSTAEVVTSVSGRGVGMDVVKTNVSRLNGMIEIESAKGVGSTFLLKLPLTLAIIQGLLVKVAEEVFIIPIVTVLETVRVRKNGFNTIGSRQVIRLRDTVIPVVHLQEFFAAERKNEEPEECYVVVVGVANKLVGLVVDKLLGQEEVVIKSLGEFFESSDAIAGATIMGDGRVRLIIDISQIVNLEQERVG
ncbi:MAG: chemotaxis protein CheA [Deferribacteres bacterium]|nr:chemotaxis protein CheA [candidate division KSB1 bacterium]MCB9501915.1 chemotaxis protein CheA [Deferribacteres bacterium]